MYPSFWSSAASGGLILGTMAKIEKQNHYRSLHRLPDLETADAYVNELFHPEGKLVHFTGTPPMYDCTSTSHTILLLYLNGLMYR